MLVNYNAIEARKYQRVRSGFDFLDNVLSGGFCLGNSYLLAGEAGAGKSTLSRQVMAAYLQAGFKVLYISLEEWPEDQKKAFQDIFSSDFEGGKLDLLKFDDQHPDVEAAIEVINSGKYGLVVIDSVQKLRTKTVKAETRSITRSVKLLYEALRKSNATGIFINQLTKEGKARGSAEIGHEVDSIIYLTSIVGTNQRMVRMMKNRGGVSGTVSMAYIDGYGLHDIDEPVKETKVVVTGVQIPLLVKLGGAALLLKLLAQLFSISL